MSAALFHPGDLSLSEWLPILLVLLGVPSLVLGLLAWAVYRGISGSRDKFTTINLERGREPTDPSRNRPAST